MSKVKKRKKTPKKSELTDLLKNIHSLPDELFSEIFSSLTTRETLYGVGVASKRMLTIAKSNVTWSILFKRDYGQKENLSKKFYPLFKLLDCDNVDYLLLYKALKTMSSVARKQYSEIESLCRILSRKFQILKFKFPWFNVGMENEDDSFLEFCAIKHVKSSLFNSIDTTNRYCTESEKKRFISNTSSSLFSSKNLSDKVTEFKMARDKLLALMPYSDILELSTITYVGIVNVLGELQKVQKNSNDFLYDLNNEYIGQTSYGVANGFGKLYTDGILIFEGQFVKGERCGKGTNYSLFELNRGSGHHYSNSSIGKRLRIMYTGSFQDNRKHGFGIKFYSPYSEGRKRYQGLFKDGKFSGNGMTFRKETGEIEYKGEFKNGMPNGFGVLSLVPENFRKLYHHGLFLDGKRHGKCIVKDKNGMSLFEGLFVNDKRNGPGKMYDEKNGSLTFDGIYKNDMINGRGTFFFKAVGRKYTGMFLRSSNSGVSFKGDVKNMNNGAIIRNHSCIIKFKACSACCCKPLLAFSEKIYKCLSCAGIDPYNPRLVCIRETEEENQYFVCEDCYKKNRMSLNCRERMYGEFVHNVQEIDFNTSTCVFS